MAQEAAALGSRQVLPQPDRHRPHTIHHRAPVHALRRRVARPAPHGLQEGGQRPALPLAERRTRPRRTRRRVALRHQAAPGQRDDRPVEAARMHRQRKVHHRQARAHDQHGFARPQPGGRPSRPGVMEHDAVARPARRHLDLAGPPPGLAGQPPLEVAGVVRQGAHVGRPHVQQVRGAGLGIGRAAGEPAGAVEQDDDPVGRQRTPQVDRGHSAREPGADDADHLAVALIPAPHAPLGRKRGRLQDRRFACKHHVWPPGKSDLDGAQQASFPAGKSTHSQPGWTRPQPNRDACFKHRCEGKRIARRPSATTDVCKILHAVCECLECAFL